MRIRVVKIASLVLIAVFLLIFGIQYTFGFELPKWFPFSTERSLDEWETKVFKGRVIYKVERSGTEGYLHALSVSSTSAIFYKIRPRFRAEDLPMISWKWRVIKFPDKEKLKVLQGVEKDHYAARVYVIFPSMIFLNSKALEYVWDETAPVGTLCTSPYSGNIKLIVVHSGKDARGEWILEKRNIFEDYRRAFGRTPALRVGAIALMSDAGNAQDVSEAYFTDIRIGYKEKR